jgi:hypothetical protein
MDDTQTIIDGVVWYNDDYALDKNGRLWQLTYNKHLNWNWQTIGDESVFDTDDYAGPVKPLRKVVWHVVAETDL